MKRLVLLVLALSTPAAAHVLLDDPVRRYDDMKAGPCGRGGGNDGRTANFSRFEPGEEIELAWTETIDHEGTWVVSFDEDGDDEGDFDDNIIYEEEDPLNESGLKWNATVTLPDVECTNCTLRLLQIMTTSSDPQPGDFYFQCADIVLGDGESAPAEVGTGFFGCSQAGSSSTIGLALLLLLLRRRRR